MNLNNIITECEKLDALEKRFNTDNYYEVVFYLKDLDEWNRVLSGVLDPAIKPAGVKPKKEDLAITEQHGSIWDNQTLYKKAYEGYVVIAILMPWSNGVNVTLKIILKKSKK